MFSFYLIFCTLATLSASNETSNVSTTKSSDYNPSTIIVGNTTIEFVNFTTMTMGERFKTVGIIPHIVPVEPLWILNVTYISWFRSYPIKAENNHIIRQDYMQYAPIVKWPEANPEWHFTLFMTYLNLTNQTNLRDLSPHRLDGAIQHHNWIRYNIPGNKIDLGIDLFKYKPIPMRLEDEHNIYVFLLFKQMEKINVKLSTRKKYWIFPDTEFYDAHRSQFNIQRFAQTYKLVELMAGNFVRAARISLP